MKSKRRDSQTSVNRLAVDPDRPDPAVIETAAGILRRGGVVVFPTRCLYGLAADAMNPAAVARVFALKRRPAANPILVLVQDRSGVAPLVRLVTPAAERLMRHFWPGLLTVVFAARASLPPSLTAGTGKIGIRVPSHPVAAALVKAAGVPLTGTSANISGQAGCARVEELALELAAGADAVLDAGPLAGGAGSTVVDATGEVLRVLREGSVSARAVLRLLANRQPQLD
ncbi:MAG: L-threonylcarbamoyladenylate synthase [Desulfobacterales bacterium]